MLKANLRKLAPILALLLIFSLVLTGCAGKKASDEAYQIGLNTWGSGVQVLDTFGDNGEYVIEMLGGTTMRASDDFTPDKESTNVQNFCSAGVDAIDLQAAGVTNLLQMAKTCQDAKVPFVLNTFIGNEADRAQLQDNNPYYVGCLDNDLEADGKLVATIAIADGCTTAVVIGGNIGDNTQDRRLQGFTDEFTAQGGTVLQAARCTDASDAPAKAEDMLSANMDVQCLYAMVGDYVPAAVSAISNLGLTDGINIYMSGVDKTSAEFIKDGTVKAGGDGLFLASYIAPTLLMNYLDGHAIKDDNDKAPQLENAPFKVDAANIDAYISIFCTEGIHPIPDEMLKNLCWRNNPDVTYQTYVDLMNHGLTLNELLKAHDLPTVD